MIIVTVQSRGIVYDTSIFSVKEDARIFNDEKTLLMLPREEADYICSKLNTNSIITITKILIYIRMRCGLKRKELLERV